MRKLGVLLACCVGLGCGSPAGPAPASYAKVAPAVASVSSATPHTWTWAPDEPFRSVPPSAGPRPALPKLALREAVLPGGTRFIVLSMPGIGWGTLSYVSSISDVELANSPEGLRYFVSKASWLSSGGVSITPARAALVEQMIDDGSQVESDGQELYIAGASAKLPEASEILLRVAMRADFTPSHIEFFKGEVRAFGAASTTDDAYTMRRVFCKVSLGDRHPYCHSSYSSDADLAKMSREVLLEGYGKLFAPSQAAIVAAGDIDDTAMQAVIQRSIANFAQPPAVGKKPSAAKLVSRQPEAFVPPQGPRVVVVDRPGSRQAKLYYGSGSGPLPYEKRAAVDVMNALLVGASSGSITRALQDEVLLSWAGNPELRWARHATRLSWEGTVDAQSAGVLIRELGRLLRRTLSSPIDAVDLEAARSQAISRYATSLETTGLAANRLSQLVRLGVPLDELTRTPKRMESVTEEDVKTAVRTWLDPDKARVVMLGDWTLLRESLRRLDMGPIEIRDGAGNVLRTEELKK